MRKAVQIYREVQIMAILSGCQEGKHTPKLEEVRCPHCGEYMEVFIAMGGASNLTGRTTADETCDACGYVIPEGTPLTELR